jgi:hypothetical protein
VRRTPLVHETGVSDGRPLEAAYGELIGDGSPEEVWSMVEERLAAGQMRLLFVAARTPLELRAIVDFLNRQMRQTDVYAGRSPRQRSPRPVAAPRSGPCVPTWMR